MSDHQDGDQPVEGASTVLHSTPQVSASGPASAQSPIALEALACFQNTMGQWLELQRSQQTANQQFLATQERVLLAFMHGAAAAAPSALPAMTAPRPQPQGRPRRFA